MASYAELERDLRAIIGPQLTEIIAAITSTPSATNPYLVELPDIHTVDLPMSQLANLVATSSNNYARSARFAGMARAEAKIAKGAYERKFKRLRAHGKNDAEREALAMTECQEEHSAMVTSDAIAELADSLESAARVASESARKIFDKAQSMHFGQQREQSVGGVYKGNMGSFEPY